MIKFKRQSNSPQSTGRITSHPRKSFSHGTLFGIFCTLYVHDGDFAFLSRRKLEIGANLIYHHFVRFDLQMHIVSDSKTSKTEFVFFPTPGHFKLPALPSTTPPPDPSSSFLIVPKLTQESEETKRKRHDSLYDDAEETKIIPIRKLGCMTFTKNFKYLRGWISYSLPNNYNFEAIISNASAAMDALNYFWNNNAINDYSNCLIFCAIPCNLLLWGCESWALREATLQKLEAFMHRNVRKILKITTTQIIEDRITNDSLRMRFFNIPSIRNQIAKRQLAFIGKVVRNTDNQIPTQLLTA